MAILEVCPRCRNTWEHPRWPAKDAPHQKRGYCSVACHDAARQALIPGADQLDRAEADNRAALQRDEATWTLRSPLAPKARRKAGPLPLLEPPMRGLFD